MKTSKLVMLVMTIAVALFILISQSILGGR